MPVRAKSTSTWRTLRISLNFNSVMADLGLLDLNEQCTDERACDGRSKWVFDIVFVNFHDFSEVACANLFRQNSNLFRSVRKLFGTKADDHAFK
jgi:hypothetical protein